MGPAVTPFSCAGFASCASADGASPPPSATSPATPTATTPFSLMEYPLRSTAGALPSLDRFPRDARDELVDEQVVDDRQPQSHQEPRAEWDREGRIDDDQRPPGVLQVERAHDARERDEEDDRRHQIRHEDADPEVLGEREAQAGERVPRRDGRQDRDGRDPEG